MSDLHWTARWDAEREAFLRVQSHVYRDLRAAGGDDAARREFVVSRCGLRTFRRAAGTMGKASAAYIASVLDAALACDDD